LPAPRPQLSRWAPKIISFDINPDKIGEVIGKGGKTINKIVEETGVKLDIEEDGRVFIATPDEEMAQKAKKIVMSIVEDAEVGMIYEGPVVKILANAEGKDFGARVQLSPNKDGMIHISKLSKDRVEKVTDVVNVGDNVVVQVIKISMKGIDLKLIEKK